MVCAVDVVPRGDVRGVVEGREDSEVCLKRCGEARDPDPQQTN